MVLVDTSIWIEVFRKRSPLDIESVLDFKDIVTCLPVVQEVLQGFQDETAFRMARHAMLNLPIVEDPLSSAIFEEAVDLFRTARRTGLTIRSSTDCLIAVCALRNDLEIVHRDRDYAALAKISRLRQWVPE